MARAQDDMRKDQAQPEGAQAEEMSLEEAFAALDGITRRLEEEDITLEESFNTYKQGMDLLKLCNEKIDQVEKKVLVLNEEGGLDEF